MNSILERVYHSNPFITRGPIPVFDIPNLYVPFDVLLSDSIENILLEDVTRERLEKFYSIIGASGSGKSSLINYFMYKVYEEDLQVFPIKIDQFETETSLEDILKNFIKKIHDYASQYNELKEKELDDIRRLLAVEYTYTSGERESIIGKLKTWINAIPLLLGLEAEVSGEIVTYAEEMRKRASTLNDCVEFITEIGDRIRKSSSFKHVIFFIDETDKITDSYSIDPSPDQATIFFNKLVPILAKTNNTYVFVMNDQYETPLFNEKIIRRYFDKKIKIKQITEKSALEKVIDKIVKTVCGDDHTFRDVFSEEAIDELSKQIQDNFVSQVITFTRSAIEKARRDNSELVEPIHVKDSVIEFLR